MLKVKDAFVEDEDRGLDESQANDTEDIDGKFGLFWIRKTDEKVFHSWTYILKDDEVWLIQNQFALSVHNLVSAQSAFESGYFSVWLVAVNLIVSIPIFIYFGVYNWTMHR